jgi:hypothetical protein
MGFFQVIVSSGALALAMGAMTMAGRNEFGWAYGLFWASVAVATLNTFWYATTTLDPAPIRVGVELVAALYVGVLLPMVFRWMNQQKAKVGTSFPNTSPEQQSVP